MDGKNKLPNPFNCAYILFFAYLYQSSSVMHQLECCFLFFKKKIITRFTYILNYCICTRLKMACFPKLLLYCWMQNVKTFIQRELHPRIFVSAGLDGFSYGGSVGELRSTCLEDFPPGLDFDSYRETLSQVNNLYPDSPPR